VFYPDTPTGIPKATGTPEEIAVSFMAEIIDIRRHSQKKVSPTANPWINFYSYIYLMSIVC
jgi:xanthine/CO dehydrogenase XdhC/CoxF family maturation factor